MYMIPKLTGNKKNWPHSFYSQQKLHGYSYC